jgi:peptidyl-prolyl cis-trans isomerase D
MISFLQSILQKHHKWLFSILLFVVIVSFVFTIGASPGIGTGHKRAKHERFFGYDLSSERDRNALFQETWLSTILNGMPIFFEAQLQNMAVMRAIELYYTQELHIPNPSEEQIRVKIQHMPLFFAKETQAFNASTYEKTIKDLLKNSQITAATIQKVLSDDWKISFAKDAIGRQGSAFPLQAQDVLIRAETQYTFDILSLTVTPEADVTFPEEEIRTYADQHGERYQEPESYRLIFISFNPERYRPQIPLATKEALKKFYFEHKKDFESLQEGSEELKQAIIDAYERSQASAMASQKANNLAYQLYEQEIIPHSETFQALIKAFEVEPEALPPFTPGQAIDDERFSPDDLTIAATLDEEQPFSDPIAMKNGSIAILVWQETIPPHPSEFAKIRDTALADLRSEKSTEQFHNKCEEISKNLSALSPSDGQEIFEERAKALGISITSFSSLKLKEAHGKVSSSALQVLVEMSEGECSQKLFQKDRCEWVKLHSKAIDETTIDEEKIQQALGTLQQRAAQLRMESFLMENLERFMKQHREIHESGNQ